MTYTESNIDTFQYGEEVKRLKVLDRYNNLFDIDEFKNIPFLFFIGKYDIRGILSFNDSINVNLKKYIIRGLKIVYIVKGKKGENDNYDNSLNIYFDTDKEDLYSTFKARKCCGSILLLSKNHKVLLSTITVLEISKLLEVIQYNEQEIFQ